jgi:hypothetical protein
MANDNEWWKQGASPVESSSPGGDWWKAGAKPVEPESPGRSATDYVRDAAAWAAKGAVAVPEAVVGLADIASGGRAGKLLENEGGTVGFRPNRRARPSTNGTRTPSKKPSASSRRQRA